MCSADRGERLVLGSGRSPEGYCCAASRVIERFLEKAAVSLNLYLPSLPQLLPVHTQQQSVASVLIRPRNGEHVPDRGWAGTCCTYRQHPHCHSDASLRERWQRATRSSPWRPSHAGVRARAAAIRNS